MANPRQIVALNVGSQRVSMGVFSKTPQGSLVLERYATTPVLLDPADEGMRLSATSAAIANLVQELGVKGSVINYSVSGQSVFIRFVKLPSLDGTDVEQLIRFEAAQHVPFPLEEVVWDYHLLPGNELDLEREAVLVAIKADDLNTLNSEVCSAGLSAGKIDCAQTSLYNAFKDSYPDETQPVMIIDIGAKSTDIVYAEPDRYFTRSISAGGVFITSAIARDLGLSFKQAEGLKLSSGMVALTNLDMSGLDAGTANMANTIRTAMTRLASEIQRTTNHYRAQMKGSAPSKIFICGGGALLRYAKEFLEEKLGVAIEYFNPLHNISVGSGVNVDLIRTEACTLGSLVGAALSGDNRATLDINLEPTDVAKLRANQRKMPAIMTGAIVAVVGAAAFAATAYIGLNQANQTLKNVEPVVKEISRQSGELRANQQKLQDLDTAVNAYRMLTLQRYGYADIIKTLLEESTHKDYPYWFTDFEPMAHFDPTDKTKITGYSVIKDTFTGDKNTSMVDDAKKANGSNDDDEEGGVYSVNAIRLTGLAMKNKGGQKLIQALQAKVNNNKDSLFTYKYEGADMEARQIMELGTKDSKTDAATGAFTPFKLVLPLKTPIPVNFNK